VSLIEHDLFRGEVDKVKMAIDRFKEFEPEEGYYLAFSGGKDSVVIKRLAQMAGVKFDAHYNVTTVDPPELVHFIKKHHKDVIFHRPKMSLPQRMMDRKFPPMRHLRWCCDEYKEGGGVGRVVATGVRRAESAKRSKRGMIERCLRRGNKRYLNPIIDWGDSDVWDFINGENIPYCSLYDEGFHRLGCVLCPMATIRIKKLEMVRWPKIAASWKRWMIRMFNAYKGEAQEVPCPSCKIHYHNTRGKGEGCEKCNMTGRITRLRFETFDSGEEFFKWWFEGKGRTDPDQMVMFE
jgi:phosphoadenosine phosphosulfate reductase